MKILIVVFIINFIIIKLWSNYIKNDLKASLKYIANGNFVLGLMTLIEYVLGGIIAVKLLLKFIK